MRIIYIDTTTSYLYTALIEDDKVLKEIKENFGRDLSCVALKKISEMLEESNYKPKDIDKIIVVNGPGSFTGIRIGVTIAKTFAYSLNKEIITISSLEAMALSSKKNTKYIVPIIDARRGFVYGGIYDNENNVVLKNQHIKLDALKVACDHLIDDYTYIGNNVEKLDIKDVEEYNPDILKIVNTVKNNASCNPHSVNPIYLKQTEAEENKKVEVL